MATIAELIAQARKDADSQYTSRSSAAKTAYESEVAAITKALNNAIANEELSKQEADRIFAEQTGQIQQTAYNQAQITDLAAAQNGINGTQQYLAQLQGDQYRTNQLNQANLRDRQTRLNDITNRINTLRQNADLDINQRGSQYNNELAGLRADSDLAYNQRASQLNELGLNQAHDIDMLLREQAFQREQNALNRAASSGGGGGGGGSYRSTGGTTTGGTTAASKTSLSNAVASYNTAKSTSNLDAYYKQEQAKRNTATNNNMKASQALAKNNPIKSVASNPNMTSYQKINMFKKDYL